VSHFVIHKHLRLYLEGWFRFLIAWFCGFISDTDEHGCVPFVVFTVPSLFPPSWHITEH